MDKKTYRMLPDGSATASETRYVREWNKLAKPVAAALGCDIIGMDPGLHLIVKGAAQGFQIPTSVALKIRNIVESSNAQ